jgi:hypothetical protein
MPEAVGKILVLGTHSYVTVKDESVDAVLAATAGQKIGERGVVVERAKR